MKMFKITHTSIHTHDLLYKIIIPLKKQNNIKGMI